MTFDEAISEVLSTDGLAMKTDGMAGYMARTASPDAAYSFGLAFRYRNRALDSTRSCPVYPIRLNGTEYIAGSPDVPTACTEKTPLDVELLALLFDETWYTCPRTECETMIAKVNSRD